MTNIDSKLVGKLRDMTGAALMDCKRALQEANGDIEAAVDLLRKKGLKNADKRAGRKAGAGRVHSIVSPDGRRGAMVLMTSETDFVPPTDDFKSLLERITQVAYDKRIGSASALLEQTLGGAPVAEALKALTGKCGENVEAPNVACFEVAKGAVGGYIHHDMKTAGFAAISTGASAEAAQEFLKELGMHIVFSRPQALERSQIPAEAVERERAVYAESDEVKSKPEDRRAKIVEGKLEKFFAGVALLEQPWFKDDKTTVRKKLSEALGADAKVEGFALFVVGA
ncbi:MAG: translation elongation factor Ts [Planctomycetes bacterium]|nr:translation elongation factor Ts [Planctomycetota bacterium]